MKKIIALLLALAMLAGLFVGCAREERRLHILFVAPSTSSDVWSRAETGFQQAEKDYEASLGIEITYEILGPADEMDTQKYLSILSNAIAAKPDAIVTATADPEACSTLAQEAANAEILINLISYGAEPEDAACYSSYNQVYTCSSETVGTMAADAFLLAAQELGADASTSVISLQANTATRALELQMQSFANQIERKAIGLSLADAQYSVADIGTAQANAAASIALHGEALLGFFATGKSTVTGVCAALRDSSRPLVAVGVDAVSSLDALRDGILSAIVMRDAYQLGYRSMENAIRTLNEGTNPEATHSVAIAPVLVTAENVDSEEIAFLLSPSLKPSSAS